MIATLNTASRCTAAVRETRSSIAVDRHGRSSSKAPRRNGSETKLNGRRPQSKRTLVLADVELKKVEDALLDALLDVHVNRDNALDRLLGDIAQVEAKEHAEAFPFDESVLSESKMQRIEEMLSLAVMDNHPNRARALDRIFDDIEAEEQRARAEFDVRVDNDFDGLA